MKSFAVIPAAGLSRRMGRPKLLMDWNGRPLIESVVATWQQSRVDVITVVVSPQDLPLQKLCSSLDCTVIVPPQQPPEMRDSVQYALNYLQRSESPSEEDCWLLAPADMPHLDSQTIDLLLDHYQQARAKTIFVPSHEGKRGHPVLFSWALAAEVQSLPTDVGLNYLLGQHPVTFVESDCRGTLQDLDTPDDYNELRRNSQK